MTRLVIDLDGTLTIDDPAVSYSDKLPNIPVVARLREYKAQGFEIVIHTARNMRTHKNNVGLINAHTLPVIIDWLRRHDIPYDEIHVGKPWSGHDGFYVDDKALRPDEFAALPYPEIGRLLKLGRNAV
ncbi:capsular biosynthesis protein [Rhodovarius crocodyli]|uniref:Capsular biosynthesis protein n=1 Tax=Rhodovarius crocodyli TaxID=1979269 RepID=A0A437LYV7_9PROT|nr:capsular biosynthesis protein [Rhodovarius crocodyli]RVT90609.1 capsular biosynthesis protein [Rhodovarius crocodyli]